MLLPIKKTLGIGFSIIVFGFIVYQIFSINRSARTTLANERARLLEQNRVPFEKNFLAPHSSSDARILQNTNDVRDFTKFQNSYFAATGGGLVEISEDGKLLRHFTNLDGLPESDLTCLLVFNDRLFIGTRTKNLIVFDGEKFENYVWINRKAQAITAFLQTDENLLIGTFDGGLLAFDGKFFTEIKADDQKIKAINCLSKIGEKLYIGTFDNGLWIYENDHWSHFTTNDGLASNRIVGIASRNENLYVATDLGVSVREENSFRAVLSLPALSSFAFYQDEFFLTKNNGEIFTFDNALKEFSVKEKMRNARLKIDEESLKVLSNQGIFEISGAKIKNFSQPETDSLTDNFVSALTFDMNENFWVGTFRRGIDIFSAADKKIAHLETDKIREINFLQANDKQIFAATSGGIQKIKPDFSVESLTKKEGLPSDSINHFSGDFAATAKGLAYRENETFRILSTVQGLPNNSVYTTLQVGKILYVGTLGGLAQIENRRVVRTFTDSNSNLTTNWITALCFMNERIFIGTYGGGIFELLPSGEIRAFESETGKFVVNPNALFSDGERLYAGTLEGVKILDLQTQQWKMLQQLLPSEIVMSITGNAQNVYFGTNSGIAEINKNYFRKGEIE